MAQKGTEKQNPPDQRSRGMNDEHAEGQANQKNHERQAGQGGGGGAGGARTAAGG